MLKRIGEKMAPRGRPAEGAKEEVCLSLIDTKPDLSIRNDRIKRTNRTFRLKSLYRSAPIELGTTKTMLEYLKK